MSSAAIQHLTCVSCLCAACLLFSAGCGGPGYAPSTVKGRITIDGAPVPKGYITFSPTGGSHGPVVASAIKNGEYRCEKVPQGKVQVTFVAQAAELTTVFDKVNKVNHEIPKDILPPAYQQGQAAEIAPGENPLDFDLKSE